MKSCFIALTGLTLLLSSLSAEEKIFKRKITDTSKKLDIRKGSLTDTKKLLRKTDSLSNTQIARLKQNALQSMGKDAYLYAAKNSPNLLQTRFKYGWLKMQLETQNGDWKRREKRDAGRSGGKLTETRAKDYKKKYSTNNQKIGQYKKAIEQLDNKMIEMSKKVISSNGDFFENTVGDSGARLTDKLGNFIVTIHKGEKAQTKHSTLDHRYYEVKYKGKVAFTLKEYFLN